MYLEVVRGSSNKDMWQDRKILTISVSYIFQLLNLQSESEPNSFCATIISYE